MVKGVGFMIYRRVEGEGLIRVQRVSRVFLINFHFLGFLEFSGFIRFWHCLASTCPVP